MTIREFNNTTFAQMTRRRWRTTQAIHTGIGSIPFEAEVRVIRKRGGLGIWWKDPATGKSIAAYDLSPYAIKAIP